MVKRKRSSSSRRPFRPYKRRRRVGGIRSRRRWIPRGLPKSYTTRLHYSSEITLNPTTGAMVPYVYRANSLFDPDYTGVGHQPYGFDQLMTWFDHYTVIGSKITVTVFNNGTTHNTPGYVTVLLSDSGTAAGSYSSIEHMMEGKQRGNVVCGGLGNPAPTFKYAHKKFSAKKFFHKKALVGASQYRGDASNNPTEGAYFEVVAASMVGNDPGPITCLVNIEYIAVFTEPKLVAQS